MKQPFMPAAICFGAGILIGRCFPWEISAMPFLCAVLGLWLATMFFHKWRTWLLVILLVFAGWGNFKVHTDVLSPRDLRLVAGDTTQLATILGRLEETPKEKLYVRGTRESWRSHAVVRVEAVRTGDQWTPASGSVVVACPHPLPEDFFRGRSVEISGVLRTPPGPLADGLFDYREYLKWQGIYHQLRTTSTNDWKLHQPDPDGPNAPPPVEQVFRWARHAIATGLPEQDESVRLMWAMTLDWRAGFTEDLEEPFVRAGTFHIFAVDGLRIGIISLVIVVFLRALRVSRPICGVILIPLVWMYVAGTGWPSTAIRAAIMCTVLALGWVMRRPGDTLNSLFVAAFAILAWDPLQLFQAGFQLSFVVVLCILVVMPVFEAWRDRILKHDPFLPEDLLTRAQRWRNGVLRFVLEWFFISLASWIGSIPLTAYYFHLISPSSLVANTVAVPLSVLALCGNIASVLCAGWLPAVALLFNHASWFLMTVIWGVSEWSARYAGGFYYVKPPGVISMILHYAVILAVFRGWVMIPEFRKQRLAMAAAAFVASLVLWFAPSGGARMDVLTESAGVLVRGSPHSGPLLIDCGNGSAASGLTRTFLGAQGVNRLDGLVVSHGDTRHIGGAGIILTNFAVKKVYAAEGSMRSPAYRNLRKMISSGDSRWQVVENGVGLKDWDALHPDPGDRFSQGGDYALVLRGSLGGAKVLLISDLGQTGQRALLNRSPDLRADIVIAEMPTQGEPLADALLQAAAPKLIVIQDSEFPAKMKAGRALRERLEKQMIPTFYVSDQGSLTLEIDGGRVSVLTADGRKLFTLR